MSARYLEGGGFARTFENARLLRLGEGEGEVNFNRGEVHDVEQRGAMVFVDFAVLTEKEMQDLLASRPQTAKALKSEPTLLHGQTGKQQLMHVMSLDGLTCCEIACLRRMRIFTSVHLAMEEMLVEASKMLHGGHADNVFQANWQKLVNKQPPGLRDTSGFHNIPSKKDLLAKAEEMALSHAMRGVPLGAEPVIDVEKDGGRPTTNLSRRLAAIPKKTAPKRKVGKAPPTPPGSEGGISKARSDPAIGVGKARSKKGRQDASLVPDASEAGQLALQEVDPQLHPVAEALKQVPPCFLRFSIDRLLKGEKLGNQLQGAWNLADLPAHNCQNIRAASK